jgi:hypothetical protein
VKGSPGQMLLIAAGSAISPLTLKKMGWWASDAGIVFDVLPNQLSLSKIPLFPSPSALSLSNSLWARAGLEPIWWGTRFANLGEMRGMVRFTLWSGLEWPL